jgi:glycosyltransferase involved in cell wall biosynthesis
MRDDVAGTTAKASRGGERTGPAMLMHSLGFQGPSSTEIARVMFARTTGRWRSENKRGTAFNLPATILHAHPLISYSGSVPHAPIGLASLMRDFQRGQPAWFLISPTWSIEKKKAAKTTHRYAVLHRLRNRGHRLIFMCNTPEEATLLQDAGEAAFFHNKTSNISESIFKPLDDASIEFDAIYNAQLAPWKRHELSLGIERCAFVFYRDLIASSTRESESSLFARHAALAPGHVFVNPVDADGTPVRLAPTEVNRHLNRAAVGLCLSETEGAMFASTEYLLAGLPVVTTPSSGGRHVYFDDEYCLTAEPNPRSIAEAVAALKARNIPRDRIRARTLERLDRDRVRFIDLINTILEESGSAERLALPWPFKQPVLMEWLDSRDAIARALSRRVDAFPPSSAGSDASRLPGS